MHKIDTYYESLVHCTKLSKMQQKQLLNWFNKQNILVQIDIFSEQKNQFFKTKSKCAEADIVPLAAFLMAISHFYSILDQQNSKNRQSDLNKSAKISDFLVKTEKKERYKEKREKLLSLWSVVLRLRDEKFSFRQISQYLKGRHRFDISHTYICNLYKELENEF